MNWNETNQGSGCGLARGKDGAKRKAPRVVLAGGPDFALQAAEYLYLMGLDVCSVNARRSACLGGAEPDRRGGAAGGASDESGFLTCAKLRLSRPKLKVVLVGESPTAPSGSPDSSAPGSRPKPTPRMQC